MRIFRSDGKLSVSRTPRKKKTAQAPSLDIVEDGSSPSVSSGPRRKINENEIQGSD